MNKFSPFHLVELSPWPIFSSLGFFNFMLSFILMLNSSLSIFFLFSSTFLLLFSFYWWSDVERESSHHGEHSINVMKGLKIGMLLFIVSEVMFFVSFFWSFIHSSSSVDLTLGLVWPPSDIYTFDPMGVPFLNTVILLSSGMSVTWCHHELISGNLKASLFSLLLTIIMGVTFSSYQGLEYFISTYTIADSVTGSSFFLSTGFHGLHVLIGSIFLIVSLLKFISLTNSTFHCIGFECAAWYWHFVDVVWLFLYTLIHWWGQ